MAKKAVVLGDLSNLKLTGDLNNPLIGLDLVVESGPWAGTYAMDRLLRELSLTLLSHYRVAAPATFGARRKK